MHKQVILVRADLKMPAGKMAAQASHAAVEAVLNSKKKVVDAWCEEGAKKVILEVQNEKELLALKKKAAVEGLVTSLIKDAGRTFFQKPTITCVGIGPDEEIKIDKISGKLKML